MDSTTRNDEDDNSNNNFGVPSDATCDVSSSRSSSSSSSSSISPAVLSFPPNGQIVIGIESRVYKSHNYLLVGRQASACDIRITHKSLSRQHSILYYQSQSQSQCQELFLKDLETKSGTYVNQRRLSKSEIYSLQHGDTIQFGKAKPIFTLDWKDRRPTTSDTTTDTAAAPAPAPAAGNNNNNNNQIDDQQQQQQQQQQNNVEDEKEETASTSTSLLTGRAQREAEIAKMMSSLDDKPTYTTYKERPTNQAAAAAAAAVDNNSTNNKANNKNIEKYKLPVSQVTSSSPIFFEDDVGDNNNNNTSSSSLATIAMDPTGARFAFGCRDSSLRIYDFAGGYSSKTNTYRPFQNIYVEEGYPCSSICYSPTSGDRILVTTTSIQPKIFDRDGNEELQFVRGDVYVRDPTKTIGHTNELVDCSWHPGVQKSIVHTISKDGSWKVWNVDNGKLSFGMLKCTDTILIKNLKSQQKTIPTCIIATPTSVVVGTECGSIQIYNYPITSKLRPQQSLILPTTTTTTTTTDNKNGDGNNNNNNNNNNTTTSHDVVQCIAVSADSTKIATRTESFVCIWDLSSKRLNASSKPILQLSGLPSSINNNNNNNNPTIAFSPNGKVLCVGVSELTQQQQSHDQNGNYNNNNNKTKRTYWNSIQFYAIPTSSTTKVKKKPIYKCYMGGNDDGEGGGSSTPTASKSPLLGLFWHIKLNQILVTTTKEFVIWYDESYSKKGILLNPQFASSSSTRKRKKNDRGSGEDALQELYASRAPPPGSTVKSDEILVPNALPLFGGETAKTKRQRRLEKEEIENSKQMPQKPSKDIYTTNNTLFAQLVMDQRGGKQKQIAGKDPREALAQYNEGKSYISSAYEGNQERILADKTVEEEEDEMKNKKK